MLVNPLGLCFFLSAASVVSQTKSSNNELPNVLFVVFDDLRWNIDDPLTHTPNLDAFSRDAVTFTHAFVQYAWCGPSRNSFLTGTRPDTIRCYILAHEFRTRTPNKLGEDMVSMSQYFKDSGLYYTTGMGKIHHVNAMCYCPHRGQDLPQSWHHFWKCRQHYFSQRGFGRAKLCSPRQYYNLDSIALHDMFPDKLDLYPGTKAKPWPCRDDPNYLFKMNGGNGCVQTEECIDCLRSAGCLTLSPSKTHCVADCPDECYGDYLIGQNAKQEINLLAQAQKNKKQKIKRKEMKKSNDLKSSPFFMAVGFSKPHLPWTVPLRFYEKYDYHNNFSNVSIAVQRSLPEQVPGAALMDNKGCNEVCGATNYSYKYEEHRADPVDEHMFQVNKVVDPYHKNLRGAYYAAVSFADEQFGVVINTLKENNLYDNTIIVVLGDHGWLLGELGLWSKITNFEANARAPLMIRVPGMHETFGTSSKTIVEFVDIYPTLIDATFGINPNDDIYNQLEGKSLMNIIKNIDDDNRNIENDQNYALSQIKRVAKDGHPELMGLSIRTQQWRYTEWLEYYGGSDVDYPRPIFRKHAQTNYGVELYNHSISNHINDYDVWDTRNFAYDDAYQSVVDEMHQLLHNAWLSAAPAANWKREVFANTVIDGTWQSLQKCSACPEKLLDSSAVSIDDSSYYVFGGRLDDDDDESETSINLNRAMYRFDVRDKVWAVISKHSDNHQGYGGVAEVFYGKIYSFGGSSIDGSMLMQYTVNEKKGVWKNITQVLINDKPYNPIGASSGLIGSKMYVAGGCFDGEAQNILIEIDLFDHDHTWKEKANIPNGGTCFSAGVAYNNLFYYFGGRKSLHFKQKNNVILDSFVYNPVTNEWNALANMPSTMSRSGQAIELNGKILIVGSELKHFEASENVYVYEPSSDTWSELPPMLIPRYGASPVAIKNVVYVAGGTKSDHQALIVSYNSASGPYSSISDSPVSQLATTTESTPIKKKKKKKKTDDHDSRMNASTAISVTISKNEQTIRTASPYDRIPGAPESDLDLSSVVFWLIMYGGMFLSFGFLFFFCPKNQ